MLKPLLILSALLAGCTPSHFYVSPSSGPTTFLQERSTRYEDRHDETLQESYRVTGIDGKTVRFNWKSAAIEGEYRLLPGPHKIIVRAGIRRGSAWNNVDEYFGVLNAVLAENRHYFINGTPYFADNLLEMWVEDLDSGAKVSEVLGLDLSKPVPRPNVVTYPIYIPAKR